MNTHFPDKRNLNAKVILSHSAFWLLYYVLIMFIFSRREVDDISIIKAVFLISLHIPLAYFNILWLVPKFYQKNKNTVYTIALLLCTVVVAMTLAILDERNVMRSLGIKIPSPPDFGGSRFKEPDNFSWRWIKMKFVFQFLLATAIALISAVYRISQIALDSQKETILLRNEQLNSELKFLKSQINPHFLFNALNNVYTLVMIKSDKAGETLLKLSDMLKYNLYESADKESVPLEKEILYINNYISLQKLKDSSISNIQFEQHIEKDVEISPMLLIPFVENAFKHGNIGDEEGAFIHIQLNVSSSELQFKVVNTLSTKERAKDETGGIGIDNVRRRLELIYPNQYTLSAKQEGNSFITELRILDKRV